jgi:hypothetical protein
MRCLLALARATILLNKSIVCFLTMLFLRKNILIAKVAKIFETTA